MGRRSGGLRTAAPHRAVPRPLRCAVAFVGSAALALAASLAALAAPVATLAADPAAFGTPTASSKFGDGVDFSQPVTVSAAIRRVEILISTPGSIGPEVQEVPDPPGTGPATLHYHLDLANGGSVPNTAFTARWRLTATDGSGVTGPALVKVYADDRYAWKSLDGVVVHVHWIEGDDAFGRRALKIGDDAVAATAKLLGVTETAPIDFFIYADQKAFYDALGPGTRENVGGQARPDIRTLFALITPDEINASWVETVVPHELTHVVFQTAVDNPYHDPPHWLNEGLAVYLSGGYQDTDRSQVEAAARDGTIIPLNGLAGSFPTDRDRFYLAYAESVSAVDRIVRVNGRDALVRLIRSYHDGVSDDEAFQAALGRTVAGFEGDWLAELGATTPPKTGPRPAPAGPLPPGWIGPQPNPSFEVLGSIPPAPAAPRPGQRDIDPIARLLIPSFSILGVVVLAVVAVVARRRLRGHPAGGAGPAIEPGWNQLYGRRGDASDDSSADPSDGSATRGPGGDEWLAGVSEAHRPMDAGGDQPPDRPATPPPFHLPRGDDP